MKNTIVKIDERKFDTKPFIINSKSDNIIVHNSTHVYNFVEFILCHPGQLKMKQNI